MTIVNGCLFSSLGITNQPEISISDGQRDRETSTMYPHDTSFSAIIISTNYRRIGLSYCFHKISGFQGVCVEAAVVGEQFLED
ncbi:hypothetical protein WN51_01587 [Melipona quadrifasciata]|uniref:Uncharacterized protein n=1 Tax=Melipona quadrifasciata TaxID=166423 RepID=A0A0N0BEB0_9HYME|nr:hypothetical protein WN51_01587 [Melipona quadrifasciata]